MYKHKHSSEKTIVRITEDFIQSSSEKLIDRQLTEAEMKKLRDGAFWDIEEARFLIYDAIEIAILDVIKNSNSKL